MDSQRMMLLMEAFDDLRALKLLESLTDRQSALSCLNETENGEITFDRYPRSAEYLQNLRETINRRIAEVLS
jgi:hypothetical protein